MRSREHSWNSTIDNFFPQAVRACKRASALWTEEKAKRQPEVDILLAWIKAIEEEIRYAVADRLKAERNTDGWLFVADTLRDEDDPEVWLNW